MTFYLHKASGTFADGGFWSFGIQTSGSVTNAAAETTWAGAVAAFFGDATVKNYFSTGLTLTLTSTSIASSTFHQTTKVSTSHSVVGAGAGLQLPTKVGMIASFYTDNATRDGRGRIFLPAPNAGVLDSANKGELDGTIAGNIATALGTLFTSLSTGGLTQILYTRRATRGGTPAYTTSQVQSRKLQGQLHVQKRRSDKIVGTTYTI